MFDLTTKDRDASHSTLRTGYTYHQTALTLYMSWIQLKHFLTEVSVILLHSFLQKKKRSWIVLTFKFLFAGQIAKEMLHLILTVKVSDSLRLSSSQQCLKMISLMTSALSQDLAKSFRELSFPPSTPLSASRKDHDGCASKRKRLDQYSTKLLTTRSPVAKRLNECQRQGWTLEHWAVSQQSALAAVFRASKVN